MKSLKWHLNPHNGSSNQAPPDERACLYSDTSRPPPPDPELRRRQVEQVESSLPSVSLCIPSSKLCDLSSVHPRVWDLHF